MNKYVEFKLDKVRNFRLSLLAQKRIEDHFKKAFFKIEHENLKIDDFANMIYFTMSDSDRKEIEKDKFLELLDENITLKEVHELFAKITEEAFGKNVIALPEQEIQPEEKENLGTGIEQYKTL
jgi:hypothetical protein